MWKLGLGALVSQQERDAVSRRTKAALAAAKARGVELGNPNGADALTQAGKGGAPLRKAVSHNADSHAEDLASVVADIRSAGHDSHWAIAAEMNRRAVLTALAKLARERGMPATRLVCTGDVAAYCGDAAGSVAALRGLGAATIRGNCEDSLASGSRDCGCGFPTGSACDLLSVRWYAHADAALDDRARAWMRDLPRFAVFRAHGRRWGVVHGGATSVNRFLWPTAPEAELASEFAAFEKAAGAVDAILAGHCGLPFIRRVGDRVWFNTGALGMPPNDGDPRTSFGLITAQGPQILRLGYDHASAAAAMRAAGLTQGYERCLETGWWPSEDVLPPELRFGAGQRSRERAEPVPPGA